MRALFAKAGFKPSSVIHHLDPNDLEIVFYQALKAEAARRDST